MTEYAPGTPSWVDLASPDVDASVRFYQALFGWEVDPLPEPEAGGYRLFRQGGQPVAGVGPLMQPQQPPAWTTYITVADAEAAAAAVTAAGGRLLVPVMDVMDAGRMAVFTDPAGAALAVWQPGRHRGAGLTNEPVSMCWNELLCRDLAAARAFYPRVFGWEAENAADGSYTEWKLGGRTIAGMLPMPAMVPAAVPSFWMAYFAVMDCDATVARARELGGVPLNPPMDFEMGRFAGVQDPQGASFSVFQMRAG